MYGGKLIVLAADVGMHRGNFIWLCNFNNDTSFEKLGPMRVEPLPLLLALLRLLLLLLPALLLLLLLLAMPPPLLILPRLLLLQLTLLLAHLGRTILTPCLHNSNANPIMYSFLCVCIHMRCICTCVSTV